MKLSITKQFQDFLKNIGLDIEIILKKAGIANKLWQEELNLSIVEYYQLLVELDKHLSDDVILALSDVDNIQMFVPPIFAALTSKNSLEAVERFAKFKKIIGPIVIEILKSTTTIAVNFSFIYKQQELPRFSILNEQLLLLNIIRKGTGENICPILVESSFEYGEKIEKTFGIKTQRAKQNRIVFDIRDMGKIFLTQNNLMWKYIETELNRKLTEIEVDKSFTNYVQKELLSGIPSGRFSLDDISQNLGLSSRTLQRNLSAENTSFKEQVQNIQKMMTLSYLKLNLSTDEISYLVGYTENSAFLRAFKKWTGSSLSEYKKSFNNEA